MILLDTTVLIDVLRGHDTAVQYLRHFPMLPNAFKPY